ncbi:MAG: TIGR02302 family protein [Rhodospirillales bacterium]|nr:TIGR02302 family protein [Rhodospirillaceae bacterium]MBT7771844.1 TIGR02302 family protein [Rhodospirillales bacterium]MBT5035990.1 TIGR02302 family protein [Rhodospirillaceae bacterium]MBT6220774.1 TIGR02302 family protein [Rhodospirillaceae bacterium]MBT6363429.1 TIGR02302 family protein [Rhodospirillaceae bacterium]
MHGDKRPRYGFKLFLAQSALLWERLWVRLWPVAGILGTFIALSLLDVFPLLPGWAHTFLLVLFAGVFLLTFWRGRRGFRRISLAQARRRLEQDSGLTHRPLAALDDDIAVGRGDAVSEALWRVHKDRMAKAAKMLRVRIPSPKLIRRDPYAVRMLVLLLLFVGLSAGRLDPLARFERALIPSFKDLTAQALNLEVWITPPAYTRAAPIFFKITPNSGKATADRKLPPADTTPKKITVPAGSAVLAQLSGLAGVPKLKIGGAIENFDALETGTEGGGFRGEGVIESGDRLAIVTGDKEIIGWPMEVVPDMAPEIAFDTPPGKTERSHLKIGYVAKDDYGLARVGAVIRLSESVSKTVKPIGDEEIKLTLPLPAPGATKDKRNVVRDLTAHPWAGMPVVIQLEAVDGRGQKGLSDDVAMLLPQRTFNHPVARAIVEQRRKLVTPSLTVRADVISRLDEILTRPKHFFDDTVVYLALSVAKSRLAQSWTPKSITSIINLLWDTALRLEDGNLSIAERDLRRRQDALMKALRKGASQKEIDRLMDQVQKALQKYFSALRQQLEKQGVMNRPLDPSTRLLRNGDIQRMIERARELAKTGSIKAAQRLLKQVQRMLRNLQAGMRPGGKAGKRQQQARKLMDSLRNLTQGQQKLLNRTYRRLRLGNQGQGKGEKGKGKKQGANPGGEPPLSESQKDAAPQEALRRKLGGLMVGFDELLGSFPRQLGRAERAMRNATRSLKANRQGPAMAAQSEVLEQLRRVRSGVSRQMMARRQGRGIRGQVGGPRLKGVRRPEEEPFGRLEDDETGLGVDDLGGIPDEQDVQRAHKILRELRRRAGDQQRSKIELDYIERLLRQF